MNYGPDCLPRTDLSGAGFAPQSSRKLPIDHFGQSSDVKLWGN